MQPMVFHNMIYNRPCLINMIIDDNDNYYS